MICSPLRIPSTLSRLTPKWVLGLTTAMQRYVSSTTLPSLLTVTSSQDSCDVESMWTMGPLHCSFRTPVGDCRLIIAVGKTAKLAVN